MASSLFSNQNLNQNLQSSGFNPEAIQSVKRMASMLKGKGNPMQILQMMGGQNPQLNQIMNLVNSKGMTPKDLFSQMAKQQGINPEQIISMLK